MAFIGGVAVVTESNRIGYGGSPTQSMMKKSKCWASVSSGKGTEEGIQW